LRLSIPRRLETSKDREPIKLAVFHGVCLGDSENLLIYETKAALRAAFLLTDRPYHISKQGAIGGCCSAFLSFDTPPVSWMDRRIG
jgi:hypothetical protein